MLYWIITNGQKTFFLFTFVNRGQLNGLNEQELASQLVPKLSLRAEI